MSKDKYGRVWKLPVTELCAVCGQPDNCGDCEHKKLSQLDVDLLKGKISDIDYLKRRYRKEK